MMDHLTAVMLNRLFDRLDQFDRIQFYYTNWEGVESLRTVAQPRLWFGSTQFHKEPQMLLKAYDIDKQAWRDFAVKDIRTSPLAATPEDKKEGV